MKATTPVKQAIRLFVVTFFLFPFSLSSQISNPRTLLEGANPPTDAVWLDLDGDGSKEMVLARGESVFNGTFYDYYGGVFLQEEIELNGRTYYVGQPLSDVPCQNLILVDIDQDGDKDVLAEQFGNTVPNTPYEIFLNEAGTLSLSSDVPSFLLEYPKELQVHDLNKDGWEDFLFWESPPVNKLVAALGQPDGTFQLEDWLTNMKAPFLVKDVNQDSIPDILHESGGGDSLELELSVAPDSFQTFLIDDDFHFQKRLLGIGNFDGNGKPDLLYEDWKKDTFFCVFNLMETDSFILESVAPVPPGGVQLIDFNLDGKLDIYNFSAGGDTLLLNDGNGHFSLSPEVIPDFPVGELIYTETDSAYSYIKYHFFTSGISTLEINGSGYQKERLQFMDVVVRTADDYAVYDIDKDGDKELFFVSSWSYCLGYLKGLPGKKFGDFVPINLSEQGPYDLSLADFDQDGNQDICYSSIGGGRVFVEYGNGDGTFSNRTVLVEDFALCRGSVAADLNADGFPEIVASSLGKGELILFANDAGQFQAPILLDSTESFEHIKVRDVDFDGDPDLLVNFYGGNNLTNFNWYKNDGAGNFSDEGILFASQSPSSYFVDMDLDGKDEFISFFGTTLFVEKWDGDEYFTWLSANISGVSTLSGFLIIDYNGDQFLDLIIEDAQNDDYQLYRNNQNQGFEFDNMLSEEFSFTLPESFPSQDSHVADLDNDGDLDYLYASGFDLKWIANTWNDNAVRGTTFWDVDQDSLYTAADYGISGVRVNLYDVFGNTTFSFSDDQGNYRIVADTGALYYIEALPPSDCWEPVYDSPLKVIVGQNGLDSIDFPFLKVGDGVELKANLSSAPTRCGFTVRYYVKVRNTGCEPISGQVSFELDPLFENFSEITLDSFTLDGNLISFPIDQFLPGEVISFSLLVEIPGVEFIGEYLDDKLSIIYDTQGGQVLDQTYEKIFSSEIRCAYDPNDKIAIPDRSDTYGKQYIVDEEIQYTIRFQNTGTDTAFFVRLVDTLSPLLDLSTFQPIDASHQPYRITLDEEERILEIAFDYIMLPDSSVNQEGSNGFFSFVIKPVEGLDDFTPILNSAGIYFDFNPPIITNDVELEYVSDLSILATEEVGRVPLEVVPNPTSGEVWIKTDLAVLDVQLFTPSGKPAPFIRQNGGLDLSALPAGMYFLEIETDRGKVVKKIIRME
jgi:hypothetical protein